MSSQFGPKIHILKGERENPLNNDIARIFDLQLNIEFSCFCFSDAAHHRVASLDTLVMHCQR